MNPQRKRTELEARITHPGRWGRVATDAEVQMVQGLTPDEQRELLDPGLCTAFRELCENVLGGPDDE